MGTGDFIFTDCLCIQLGYLGGFPSGEVFYTYIIWWGIPFHSDGACEEVLIVIILAYLIIYRINSPIVMRSGGTTDTILPPGCKIALSTIH